MVGGAELSLNLSEPLLFRPLLSPASQFQIGQRGSRGARLAHFLLGVCCMAREKKIKKVMKNYWRLRAILISTVVVMLPIMAAMGEPVLHKVGGSKGWINHDINYTEWSAHEQFFLGDWLLFNFDKRYFNVLEVNETSYENCRDEGFVKNLTRGGRDVVQVTEARTYYYLSSGGYCFQGMKVAVTVQHGHREAAPAPSPSHSSASSAFSVFNALDCLAPFMVFWGIISMIYEV